MLFQLKPHTSQLAPFPVDTHGGELEIHLGLTQCNLTRWKRNPDTEYYFSRRSILDPVNHHITSLLDCVFHKRNIGRQNFSIYTLCFCQQNCSLFRFSTAMSLDCRILNFTEEESLMWFCFKVFDSKYMQSTGEVKDLNTALSSSGWPLLQWKPESLFMSSYLCTQCRNRNPTFLQNKVLKAH